MMSYDLPSSLQLRLIAFYSYEKIHQAHATFGTIFANLSPQLNFELRLFLYYEQVVGVPLFESCQPRVLRELVLRLDDRLFLPGDYICRFGDKGDTMYFICKGYCSVIGPNMTDIFVQLGPGGHFGEIAVIMGQKRTAYVRANGFCLTASLTKFNFEDIMKDNPEELRVVLSKMSSEKKQHIQALGRSSTYGHGKGLNSMVAESNPTSGTLKTGRKPESGHDDDDDDDVEEGSSSGFATSSCSSSEGEPRPKDRNAPSVLPSPSPSAVSLSSCLKGGRSSTTAPPVLGTDESKKTRLSVNFENDKDEPSDDPNVSPLGSDQ